MPRRYLIAPDKFKGSLTARQAAAAIADGLRKRVPDAVVDVCPIADGGDGFMETLAAALNGTWISCPAVDALGRAISSRYLIAETSKGRTAILEMAETAGLQRLAPDERNPLAATTRGVGMQIADAARRQVDRIVLGLGGSATNDGGCGMAAALGMRFLDADGVAIDPIPANLSRLSRIDRQPRLLLPPITAACDVDNPFLGDRGATAVFSTQKGATPAMAPLLESALARVAAVTGANDAANTAGAGAAGGLGFGLLHFAGAGLVPGFDLLAGLLDLENRIRAADEVITGEGSLDAQSLSGKGPVALARLARSLAVPVTAYCGRADADARACGIFQAVHSLDSTGLPVEILMRDAAALLADLVAQRG